MPMPRPTRCFAAWWQILRVGNVFTAASNVVAGYLLAVGSMQSWRELLLLIASSMLLYEAGMVLNDRFDIEQDRRERPGRPIPSGRITPQAALRAGLLLLGGGIFFACLAGWLADSSKPAVVGVLLASAVVGYDAGLKKFWSGPLVMGLCRALNVLLGASLASQWQAAPWLVAVAIGLYTVGLTLFARSEAGSSPRRDLLLGGVIALTGMGLVALLPAVRDIRLPWEFWALLWAGLIGWAATACYRAARDSCPQNVQAAVVRLILMFIVIDSVICLAVSGPGLALVILSLLVPMRLASHWAPMT
jgi:4-hydroxybenzoate polyprenyltransferase